MDLKFITEMFIPVIIAGCLVVGYILKKWLPMDNKFIPTVLTVIGIVGDCIMNSTVSVEVVVAGAVSGLASTGLHQAFTQLLNLGDNKEVK